MKNLTIAQAAKELNALCAQRLTTGTQDEFLKTRVAQFTTAVDTAITQIQSDLTQLRKEVDALKR